MPTNKKPPSSTDPQLLAEELERLSSLLKERFLEKGTAKRKALVLARLTNNLSASDLDKLRSAPFFNSWITLNLDREVYPALSELQGRLDKLSFESEHDPLTGLHNRRAFSRTLEMELERSKRERTHLSLAILDIDDFKEINDRYGHLQGDEVLKTLGGVMSENKRSYDLAARIGGEEFALILPGAGPNKAKAMLDRILWIFRSRKFKTAEGEKFKATFSAGVSSIKGRVSIDGERLISMADKVLYEAKSKGKNLIIAAPQIYESDAQKATMVHSDEKKFLFSGGS